MKIDFASLSFVIYQLIKRRSSIVHSTLLVFWSSNVVSHPKIKQMKQWESPFYNCCVLRASRGKIIFDIRNIGAARADLRSHHDDYRLSVTLYAYQGSLNLSDLENTSISWNRHEQLKYPYVISAWIIILCIARWRLKYTRYYLWLSIKTNNLTFY